jgi:ABC-type phosphate/phosphonate transport system substrate-binding protein
MTKFRLVGVAALAALTIAGCGGGDDNSSNKTLSYAAVGTEMNKICNQYNPQIKAITGKLTGDPANDAKVYDELIPKLLEGTAKFKALDPPSELQADFDKFNSITDQQVSLIKQAQTAAKAGDKQAYQQVLKQLQKSNLDEQNDLEASKLGAGDCIDKSS